MQSPLFTSTSSAKTSTRKGQQKRFKVTTYTSQTPMQKYRSQLMLSFPLWQLTMPLGLVLVAAILSLTAYVTTGGRYVFDFHLSHEQLSIRTDVDKRELLQPDKDAHIDAGQRARKELSD